MFDITWLCAHVQRQHHEAPPTTIATPLLYLFDDERISGVRPAHDVRRCVLDEAECPVQKHRDVVAVVRFVVGSRRRCRLHDGCVLRCGTRSSQVGVDVGVCCDASAAAPARGVDQDE